MAAHRSFLSLSLAPNSPTLLARDMRATRKPPLRVHRPRKHENVSLQTFFISEHGSWDRSPLSGYQVVFVSFQQGRPVGAPQPVVTGFYSADESQLFGAPVGLAQDKEGALLVADDVGNVVWRVTAAAH